MDQAPPRACTWCGRPCGPDDSPRCLACTLLSETDETDDSERWNYPEQHHDS